MFRLLPLLMACMLLVFYVDGFLVGAPIPLALGFALVGVVVLGPDRSECAHALRRRGPDGAGF